MNQKSDNIKLLVFIHSVCPYKNYSLECFQQLQTYYRVSNQFSDDSNNRTFFSTLTMVYGWDLVSTRPGIHIHQNRVRTFATFRTRAAQTQCPITSNVRQKCLFLDRSTGHLEVWSTYLGWTTGFNSDGVFTMESCSPSFSPLNFTLIMTFVQQSEYHLTLPCPATGPPTIAFHRSSKGQG